MDILGQFLPEVDYEKYMRLYMQPIRIQPVKIRDAVGS